MATPESAPIRIMFICPGKTVILPASADTTIGSLRSQVLEKVGTPRAKLILSGRLLDNDSVMVGQVPGLLESSRVRVVPYTPASTPLNLDTTLSALRLPPSVSSTVAELLTGLYHLLLIIFSLGMLRALFDFFTGYAVTFFTYRHVAAEVDDELSRTPFGPRRQMLLFERARQRHRDTVAPGDSPWI